MDFSGIIVFVFQINTFYTVFFSGKICYLFFIIVYGIITLFFKSRFFYIHLIVENNCFCFSQHDFFYSIFFLILFYPFFYILLQRFILPFKEVFSLLYTLYLYVFLLPYSALYVVMRCIVLLFSCYSILLFFCGYFNRLFWNNKLVFQITFFMFVIKELFCFSQHDFFICYLLFVIWIISFMFFFISSFTDSLTDSLETLYFAFISCFYYTAYTLYLYFFFV